MVLALVLLPAFAETLGGHVDATHGAAAPDGPIAIVLLLTLAKVAGFALLAALVGPRVVPWILIKVARTGSRELFTLSVLALALGIALGSAAAFGVSFALGAFFAGVIMSESQLSHRAAANSLPLQDAFSVLFFVSIGMLFDPTVLVEKPLASARRSDRDSDRQADQCIPAHSSAALSRRAGARHRRRHCADRRILVHPCRPRRRLRAGDEGRTKPDPGRCTSCHRHQSARLPRGRKGQTVDRAAIPRPGRVRKVESNRRSTATSTASRRRPKSANTSRRAGSPSS